MRAAAAAVAAPSRPLLPAGTSRRAIGQEMFVEKLICHYPAYKAKRLRVVDVAPGIYTCYERALKTLRGFLRAVSSGHTCVTPYMRRGGE